MPLPTTEQPAPSTLRVLKTRSATGELPTLVYDWRRLRSIKTSGKLLGLAGLLYLILSGTWPLATVVLVLTNDVIWWGLFVLYLRDSWPAFRREINGEH